MVCPYCRHTFPLTWARYFSSPTGAQTCPRCRRVSTLRYFTPQAATRWRLVIGAPAFFLIVFFDVTVPGNGLTLGFALASVLLLPVDRWIAAHKRALVIFPRADDKV